MSISSFSPHNKTKPQVLEISLDLRLPTCDIIVFTLDVCGLGRCMWIAEAQTNTQDAEAVSSTELFCVINNDLSHRLALKCVFKDVFV